MHTWQMFALVEGPYRPATHLSTSGVLTAYVPSLLVSEQGEGLWVRGALFFFSLSLSLCLLNFLLSLPESSRLSSSDYSQVGCGPTGASFNGWIDEVSVRAILPAK